jgi:hypothetical protein
MLPYALTIFIGAFLLFQVQPLIGKYILPWFGGGPGVWTTCLLFFQVLLLGGYAYAHWLTRGFKPRVQGIIHLLLLAAASGLLPITPADSWKPDAKGDPTWQILVLLAACLGLPYFVLSSTGPLIQQWFSRANPGASPYRLYALSNTGSLLALVSYPFFFEPNFARNTQAGMWGWCFFAFVVACGFCAVKTWRTSRANSEPTSVAQTAKFQAVPAMAAVRVPALHKVLWLLLPSCASVLLLATTNKICQDVAVIPFLWVLPLALYLLSFIICFDDPRWYARFPFAFLLIASLGAMVWALFAGTDVPLRAQIWIYSAGLFVCCMVCHGELYGLKPEPQHLTGFYLLIAAGGALGGLFVALVAPLLFTDYFEIHCGLLLCAVLFLWNCLRERGALSVAQWRWLACAMIVAVFVGLDFGLVALVRRQPALSPGALVWLRLGMWGLLALMILSWVARGKFQTFPYWRLLAGVWLVLGVAALGVALRLQARDADDKAIAKFRSFYGTLKVCEYRKDEPDAHYFLLQHGRITHGIQFTDPRYANWPTTYYSGPSGIALAVRALPELPRRIGVIGLGTGSMAVFGRAGDYLRIYEINPQVQQVATSHFRYLTNCPAQIEIVLGDARLSMEREPPQKFDLLALDAFTSDAIPVHLLTREAFELYARHIKTNGIIILHTSNQYLDLEPVAANAARHFNFRMATINHEEDPDGEDGEWWVYSSTWIILTRNEQVINLPFIQQAAGPIKTNAVNIPLWTDDFASLFQIME